jgi:hypothetical protein
MCPLPTLPEDLRSKGQIYTTGTVEETLWNAQNGPRYFLATKGWSPRSSRKETDPQRQLKMFDWKSLAPSANQRSANSSCTERRLRKVGSSSHASLDSADKLDIMRILMEVGDDELYHAVQNSSKESRKTLECYIQSMYTSIIGACRHAFEDMTHTCCFESEINLIRVRCMKRKELLKRLRYPDIKSQILHLIQNNSSRPGHLLASSPCDTDGGEQDAAAHAVLHTGLVSPRICPPTAWPKAPRVHSGCSPQMDRFASVFEAWAYFDVRGPASKPAQNARPTAL